ncbi:YhcH/YjgK/YiaL family protein, partial [Streptococcus pneumoniae]|nr:YhcH/YjgK/YiaL family protein [Streptococcus pneumoniae]
MIITKISRLGTYVGVNPHFATLIDFLEKTGLENLTEGSIAIDGNRLFGNCFTYPQLFTPNLKTIQNPCLSLDPGWFLFS